MYTLPAYFELEWDPSLCSDSGSWARHCRVRKAFVEPSRNESDRSGLLSMRGVRRTMDTVKCVSTNQNG